MRARLRLRAGLLAAIRAFFAERDVLEVVTPALSTAGATAPELHSFTTCYDGPGGPRTLYLHTSPEFAMKRLLAAGSGSIYQLAGVFRNGEHGRRHSPEFMLLEWYRVGFTWRTLIDEVDALLRRLLTGRVELAPSRVVSYRSLFRRHLAIDPLTASPADLAAAAARLGDVPVGLDRDDPDPWRDHLFTRGIEPALTPGRPWFVYHYPASQAALARVDLGTSPPVAERFELYLNGVELANGFQELNDAAEQRRRFDAENAARARHGLPPVPRDERLLAALDALPDCAGVALGVDRLLMLASGATRLDDVLTLPFECV